MSEKTVTKPTNTAPLAMVQIPIQEWNEVYEPAQALQAGTIFPELDKPFFMGGDKRGK